jgi:DNA polymerase elongation subunit (family B)
VLVWLFTFLLTERELLVRWAELMRELAPHIVTGYNIFGFD